jgi:LuxR family quorum-sensing system transcriptional regulator CciR
MVPQWHSKSSFLSGDTGANDAASDVAAMAESLRRAGTVEELSALMGEAAFKLGFRYHALVHHADIARPPARFIFVQNYPRDWVEAYARAGLHRTDPAQRLASVRPASFAWQDLPQLTALSAAEQRLMGKARSAGLGEGFTVPLHAPGERAASCSFATIVDEPLPGNALLAAELLAHVAFSTLFDLLHYQRRSSAPRLTARQEECVVLMSQGKTDWEIATILGLGEETVTAYLKAARQRFGVSRRTQLALAAVSYGLIGFDEIVSWQHPPKER